MLLISAKENLWVWFILFYGLVLPWMEMEIEFGCKDDTVDLTQFVDYSLKQHK